MIQAGRNYFLILAMIVVAVTTSCGPLPPDRPSGRARPVRGAQPMDFSDPALAQRATGEATNEGPLIQFWDNGNFLNGRPSSLLFAVWQDGRVMRLLNGRTYIGVIPTAEVSRLVDRLALAGVESTSITTGVVYPDGGSQLLYIDSNGVQIALRHDNTVGLADLDNYDLPANVTRPQLTNFVNIWTRCVAALDDVWPLHMDLVSGMPAVPYPAVR